MLGAGAWVLVARRVMIAPGWELCRWVGSPTPGEPVAEVTLQVQALSLLRRELV